jgi:immune inhibitor A
VRKFWITVCAVALIGGGAATVRPAEAAPSGSTAGLSTKPATQGVDDRPNPLEQQRRSLRQEAVSRVVSGTAIPQWKNGSLVVNAGGNAGAGGAGKYVELAREQSDHIFVILAEFGNQRHPDYPDQDTSPDTPGPVRFDGPLRNEIDQPDRSVDNSTIWKPDFDQKHFQDLYFSDTKESLKTYYQYQSSGRYSVDGTVTDWVKVPYNEARYGRSDGYPCPDVVCANAYELVKDAANRWVADQEAQGKTPAQIATMLAEFDQWDRYDHDGDGDFNEPDGYIDHFQVVHAGGDQADGDPYQGEDAIWSHRDYAFISDAGVTGPPQNPLGGTQIGDTGMWIGDYTMQPENGGLSVFAHEYGHDLGLPDDYDVGVNGGDNPTEYWTLMGQSRLSAAKEPIGTRPGDIGAWQKLQLGWLSYHLADAGDTRTVELGPAEYNGNFPQALIVRLPLKQVVQDYGDPYAGEQQYWSGKGNDLENTMTRTVDLTGVSSASLSMQARYEIEEGYDYEYVEASTDGGASWTKLDGTIGGEPFARDGSDAPALTGSTGGDWLPLDVSLDAYAGAPGTLRFRYRTDSFVDPIGFFADDITLTADGASTFVDGAEAGTDAWELDGFKTTTGVEEGFYDNYYIAANRTYGSFDRYLQTGPYNFGFPTTKPNWVEHFSYERGVLVTYWDTSQSDNATSDHPGEGLALEVDAHPAPIAGPDGEPWRGRVGQYDGTFGQRTAASYTLHSQVTGKAGRITGLPGQPVFDDTKQWWYPEQPGMGVKTRNAGVRINVLSERNHSVVLRLTPTAPA